MFFNFKKKLFAALTTVAVMLNTGTGVLAINAQNESDASDSMAYLEFDSKYNTYRLMNESGDEYDEYFYETENYNAVSLLSDEEAVVTTTVTTQTQTTQTVAATTNIITGTVILTTVTTKTVSPAKTVPDYTGRYRQEGNSEWESYLNSYTTTTTTTTTTTSKKVYDGIDVSRHQGVINWSKVKAAGVEFVMIRAGYGMESDQVDAKFHVNIKAAQAVGIECGVYWYSYALNTDEALREAKLCYNTIKDYKLTYPVSFDIEDPSQKHLTKKQISDITTTFCNYLESKNYYVSVYSYASMLNDKMNSSVLSNYDIWVAHTGVSKPNFSGKYGMWQYSWTGRIDGISTDVDLDYAYKNYPDIIKKGKFSGNT